MRPLRAAAAITIFLLLIAGTLSAAGPKKKQPGTLVQSFLGSCFYWGTPTPCADIYPRDQDFTIFEKYAEARRTGKMDNEFLES